jgi:long-chain fatty acid transport protein
MKVSGLVRRNFVVALLMAALVTLPAQGAGFSIYEQGHKATGMANAFTAQADDPSAMFYNAGGLAFFNEREFMAGATFMFLGDSDFKGVAPFPGPTQTGSQSDQIKVPIHAYWVEPISDDWVFGLALTMPFVLLTEWHDPEIWSGRFLSTKAEISTIDLNPNIGWQVTDNLGLGFGVALRISDFELSNNLPAINPYTLSVDDVAEAELGGDTETDMGWNFGVQHRVNDRFSWGFSYRSKVETDYGGDVELTQILTGFSDFDDEIAAALPFDQGVPFRTSIEFPDLASVGVAYRVSPSFLVEADINWTGWSSFDELVIVSQDDPTDSETIEFNWDDSNTYRAGLIWDVRGPGEWRFGVYYDETPQPDESVGPILPDADRVGISAGYGRPLGRRTSLDLSLLLVEFDDRTTTTNTDNFNGTYETTNILFGATIGW